MVHVGDSVGKVVSDQRHMRRRERSLGGAVPQVRAADQFHHEVRELRVRVAEVGTGVEQCHEGVVAHPGEDADFLALLAGVLDVVRAVAEDLDGDLALQEFVMGTVDGGLASPANEFFDR